LLGYNAVGVPVKFVRRDGMLPLLVPEPVTEQLSCIEELRSFFGNLSQGHFALVVAWLVSCFRDTGVYPVLMVHGESGSGKTILTKLLMDLIDPRDEKALSIPKDDRALIVFAKQTFLIGFENISHIPTWFSDALCRLASGDSFVAVKLYTDDELAIHKAKRPVIVNGIPRLAEREDLANPTFTISLPPMTGDRLTEPELLQRWQGARPRILAGPRCAMSMASRCRKNRALSAPSNGPWLPSRISALTMARFSRRTRTAPGKRRRPEKCVFCGRAGLDHDLQLPMPGTLALCRKRRKRLEGLFTVTTPSLNRVQSLRSMRPGKSPAAMLGEAECASGKPGERRRHLRYPRRSRPLPHFDAFASAAFSAARAPARMLAMA
jgi:hypothetical protein